MTRSIVRRSALRRGALAVALCVAFGANLAQAAIPPKSADELYADADAVWVGGVEAVYHRDEGEGDHVDRHFAIALRVLAVEKGDGHVKGALVYTLATRPLKRPATWVGPQGQHHIPAAGELVRAHVQFRDGTLHLDVPNGLEPVPVEALTGKLVHKRWTKSIESFHAGGSDYYVLEQEGGAQTIVQPSTPAVRERLAGLAGVAGQTVTLRGAAVRGWPLPPPDPDEPTQRPAPGPTSDPDGERIEPAPERVGAGFLTISVEPIVTPDK